MRLSEIKDKTLHPPSISVGDEVKVGKFKNRKAEVKGFTKDEHGQPVLKTTKGDQKLYKPRVTKLEPKEKKLDEISKTEFVDRLKDPLHSAILKLFNEAETRFNDEGFDFSWACGDSSPIVYAFSATIQENSKFASIVTAYGVAKYIAEIIFVDSGFTQAYGLSLYNTRNIPEKFEFSLHAVKAN